MRLKKPCFWVNGSERPTTTYNLHAASSTPLSQARKAQTLKPSSPQTLKPSNPQTLKPSNPQALKPSNPQTLKPSNPQTLKPSSPQTLKPSSPQTFSNPRCLRSLGALRGCSRGHGGGGHNGQPWGRPLPFLSFGFGVL